MVGPRSRRICLSVGGVAALLLASSGGCAPAPVEVLSSQRAESSGQTIVLARFLREEDGSGVAVHGGFGAPTRTFLWRMDDGVSITGFGTTVPSAEAGTAGWVAQALPPGRYFLRIGSADRVHGLDYTFRVLPAVSATYVGSFPLRCLATQRQDLCWSVTPPSAQPAESVPRVPAHDGAPNVALATRADLTSERVGWPLPASIEVSADGAAWRTSVNWLDFVDQTGSREAFQSAGRLMDAAAPIGSVNELGALVVSPLVAAALVSVAVGAAATASEAAEANRTQQRWTTCLQRLGTSITPESLAGQVPPPPVPAAPAGQQRSRMPLDGAIWQASVTRVTLRRCGEPTHLGVETAVRWRSADRETYFVRQVSGPRDDPALVFSRPAPWEAPLRDWAACRPLEAYCAVGGEQLVLDEIGAALLAGRDALLAWRQ